MVTNIPNVQNWTVTPQNGQPGYFTLMNTWLGQSTLVIASLQTAIVAQNKANSEINALAIQAENNAIVATGLANYQGAWSNSITYSKGQSVSVGGLYYISKIDSNLNHLATDTNYWLYNPINDKINKVASTDNAIVRFSETTGDVQNSSVIIDDDGNLLLTSGTGGLGYGSGAGGAVTQLTSKSTAVTLNKPSGKITMSNSALAAGASVIFSVNNSLVGSNDMLYCSISDGVVGDKHSVLVWYVQNGIFYLKVTNDSISSYSAALVINFSIIKGAIS